MTPAAYATIRINEIMYNPKGKDTNREFIEIYHDPITILSGFNISDSKNNETLIPKNIVLNSQYSLIVEDDTILKLPNVSIYTTDSTICHSGLNNDETITLYDLENNILDSVTINSSIANNNGYSLEYFNGSFYESLIINGTPGIKNSIKEKPFTRIKVSLKQDRFFAFVDYDDIFYFRIDKDNCSRKENISYIYTISTNSYNNTFDNTKEIGCSGYSETGYLNFNHSTNLTICINLTQYPLEKCFNATAIDTRKIPCNVSASIESEQLFDKTLKFKNTITNNSFPFEIEYWIEDIFGNIIKKPYKTKNQYTKSFTPKYEEKDMAFIIRNRLYVMCNNNGTVTSSQLVATGQELPKIEDNIVIIDYDANISFGSSMNLKLEITKGDSRKNSIRAYVKGKNIVSDISKVNAYSKNIMFDISMNIQLKPNCNSRYHDGDYTLIIDGLGKRIEEPITVSGKDGSLCPINKNNTTQNNSESIEPKTIIINRTIIIERNITINQTQDTSDAKKTRQAAEEKYSLYKKPVITGNYIAYESKDRLAFKKTPYLISTISALTAISVVISHRKRFK
jgi:hypothetical protein